MENPYRPIYHFSPPAHWMNDPNGLVFHEGEWHLFYQYAPPHDHRKHWGHAVSHDLVRWQHLPVALFPDELGAIWSGSVVIDRDDSSGFFDGETGLVAIFTHQQGNTQSQSLAYSRDQGRIWSKFADNPVLTSTNPNFRDPKVFWHEATKRWVMILATGDCVSFYTSPDLMTWHYASSFDGELNRPDLVWECPDLFPLPVDGEGEDIRWVLNASLLSQENFTGGFATCEMRHFIGHFG